MSQTLSYNDFSPVAGSKPSEADLEAKLKEIVASREPLTLTVKKPLALSGATAADTATAQDYILPFEFDIKVFSIKGEFRIKPGPQWSAQVNVTVTLIGAVSRTVNLAIDYQHAESCQGISLGNFASVDLCVGIRSPKLCAYVRGKVSFFGASASFDETIACIA